MSALARPSVAAALFLLAACGGSAPPAAAGPEPERAASTPIALASTSFIIESCPEAKKMDSRAAETAMRRLVEPCSQVPHQAADFLATLVPGGRIEIASRGTDATEGVVPICILKNQLTHSVSLKQRCTFKVKLEAPAAVSSASPPSEPAPRR